MPIRRHHSRLSKGRAQKVEANNDIVVESIVDLTRLTVISTSYQDLRQGRACPGAHPRPPGFRQQSPDAHPPGPSKKAKWTPTRPLGECLNNTPTHPAHRKRTKFGVGARSPLKRHPVARWPVGLEAGVPTLGACRWPLHLNFVIPGDPERFFVYSCTYYRSYCPH